MLAARGGVREREVEARAIWRQAVAGSCVIRLDRKNAAGRRVSLRRIQLVIAGNIHAPAMWRKPEGVLDGP
jgi:hypothetical protein